MSAVKDALAELIDAAIVDARLDVVQASTTDFAVAIAYGLVSVMERGRAAVAMDLDRRIVELTTVDAHNRQEGEEPWSGSLWQFLQQEIDAEDFARAVALQVGESMSFGGGAAVLFDLKRLS